MWIKCSHHSEPSAVARAGHANATVVVGYVFQEPLDGVVSVGTLVDRTFVFGIARLPQHDELPFGLEPSSNILHHENETLGGQLGQRRRQTRRIEIARSIRS